MVAPLAASPSGDWFASDRILQSSQPRQIPTAGTMFSTVPVWRPRDSGQRCISRRTWIPADSGSGILDRSAGATWCTDREFHSLRVFEAAFRAAHETPRWYYSGGSCITLRRKGTSGLRGLPN